MKTQTYPSDLTDEQWQHIKDLIPAAKAGGRPRRLDMKAVVNAIMYVVVGGVQWRMLPREYPNWKSVYHYFRQWRDNGVWQAVHDRIRVRVRQKAGKHKHPTAGSLDSQSVKASEWSGSRGFDGGKHINGKNVTSWSTRWVWSWLYSLPRLAFKTVTEQDQS